MIQVKGFLVAAAVLAGGVATAEARNASGIYLTAADYQNRRLTSESDCNAPGHKVELHDVLRKPFIDVTHDGETRQFLKSEVYGFRTCDGREFRFVDNKEYQILEALGLSIYSVDLPAREGKDLARGRATVREYFFSVGAAGPVVRLTRENLKRALPDNHRFHDSIDQMFTSDEDASLYDAFHKMFKVNRLLIASMSADR